MLKHLLYRGGHAHIVRLSCVLALVGCGNGNVYARILSPMDGSSFSQAAADTIFFNAEFGTDDINEIFPADVQWFSDIDGKLGGRLSVPMELPAARLSIGEHKIIFIFGDRGNDIEDSVTITIVP